MAFEIFLTPAAVLDVDEAITWYELKKAGLGRRFFYSLEQTLRQLEINPLAFFSVTPKVKRSLIRNFPYKVFYTVAGKKSLCWELFTVNEAESTSEEDSGNVTCYRNHRLDRYPADCRILFPEHQW